MCCVSSNNNELDDAIRPTLIFVLSDSVLFVANWLQITMQRS